MRSRIKIKDKWYKPVPWVKENDCDGCCFQRGNLCINGTEKYGSPCDDGNEFTGMVLIPVSKEAYEKYMHEAVLRKFDNAG